MNKKSNKILILTFVICGLLSMTGGATFAYFTALTTSGANDIKGKSFNVTASVAVDPIVNGEIIPLKDNLLSSALNSQNVCIDSRNYTACNLYKITLSNTGEAQTLTGYLETLTGTTFGNNVLKYELLTYSNGVYTATSDAAPLSTTGQNNFEVSNTEVTISLQNGTTTPYSVDYYLVIWLSDDNSNQLSTQDKHLNAQITFNSSMGNSIKAVF